jgi:hypothetical protein
MESVFKMQGHGSYQGCNFCNSGKGVSLKLELSDSDSDSEDSISDDETVETISKSNNKAAGTGSKGGKNEPKRRATKQRENGSKFSNEMTIKPNINSKKENGSRIDKRESKNNKTKNNNTNSKKIE